MHVNYTYKLLEDTVINILTPKWYILASFTRFLAMHLHGSKGVIFARVSDQTKLKKQINSLRDLFEETTTYTTIPTDNDIYTMAHWQFI